MKQSGFEQSSYFRPYRPIPYLIAKPKQPETKKLSVWEALYTKGLQNKKATQHRHKNKIQRADDECTFNPKTRSKSSRVFNQIQFMQRTNIWQQNKTIKIIKQQQQELQKQYRQCTFSPITNKRKVKRNKNNEANLMILNESQIKQPKQLQQFKQKNHENQKCKTKQKAGHKVGFNEVKDIIKKQLFKIRL